MMTSRTLLLVILCVFFLAWTGAATAQPGSAAVDPPVGPSEMAKGSAYGPRFTDLPIGGPVFEGDPPYGRKILRDARLVRAVAIDGPIKAIPVGEEAEEEEPVDEFASSTLGGSAGGGGSWNGGGGLSPIPEPATLTLAAMGLLGLLLLRRKR